MTGSLKRLPSLSALSWDDCRLLVESVADYAIFMLDPQGIIATWNLGAEKIKGYRPDEIVGHHFSRFYVPEDRANGKPARALGIAAAEGRYEEEGWRLRKDGTRFWADVVITALRGPDGALRGFAKVTRDLTERRLAEEELRRSEERFRLLVDGVVDYAIYMLDPEGRVTTWNRGAERMKGFAADEIVGRSFSRFFPAEDVAAGKPERELEMARTEGHFEDEGWRVRKDGTRFWANVVVTALIDARGELVGYSKVTRDLTARREAEEIERRLVREQAARAAAEASRTQLEESEERYRALSRRLEALLQSEAEGKRRAEEANRIKDEFLATVSHELRTPLNVIVGWATLLRSRALDAQTAKGVEVIHRNAEAQARIVDDILDVSRIITGKLRLVVAPMDLGAVVADALEVVRPSADAKGIALEVEGATLGALVGDADRLRQVVWNLLMNAVKFTERGGRITVTMARNGPEVRLTVQDTGRGIDPEFLPSVFDRFQQADSSSTRKFGGLGLGLAIVRHIVELHGGRVSAASEGRDRGARFDVVLPVRAVSAPIAATEVAREDLEPAPPGVLAGVRVLVVDDDADARDLIGHVLTGAGAAVEMAPSASTGLDALRRGAPHVIVSDIGMPEEDGYGFIRRLRAMGAESVGGTPAIALTAYTRAEDRAKAVAAGFDEHIGKPVRPADLVAAVARLAARDRAS